MKLFRSCNPCQRTTYPDGQALILRCSFVLFHLAVHVFLMNMHFIPFSASGACYDDVFVPELRIAPALCSIHVSCFAFLSRHAICYVLSMSSFLRRPSAPSSFRILHLLHSLHSVYVRERVYLHTSRSKPVKWKQSFDRKFTIMCQFYSEALQKYNLVQTWYTKVQPGTNLVQHGTNLVQHGTNLVQHGTNLGTFMQERNGFRHVRLSWKTSSNYVTFRQLRSKHGQRT